MNTGEAFIEAGRSTWRSAVWAALLATSVLAAPGWSQGRPGGGAPGSAMNAANGAIRGSVVDGATGRPIASASVGIWSVSDSSLVTGALTRPDGSFTVEGLRPGRYYARASYVGYTPLRTPAVSLSGPTASVEMGALKLSPSAVAVEGIQVTGEKREVRLAPDKNTFSVKDMPAATGGTAIDVLRNVPSVEVDGTNNVSLRGNQNVVVQINGRPTPIRGEQLGNFLSQLPSNMVDRVEVIPNPSAKYDPEGMAGIINIQLKQNTDLGTSGGLTLGGGSTGQVNASGNLGYQKGALTLFGNYGFMRDDRSITGYSNRQILGETSLPYTFLNQDMNGSMNPLSHTFNGSAEYKLDKKNVLGSNLILNVRNFDRVNRNFNTELDAGGGLLAREDQRTDANSDGTMLDYALNYKRTIQPRLNEWTTEFRYNRRTDDNANLFTIQPLVTAAQPSEALPARQTTDISTLNNDFTLQSDLTRVLGGSTKLETGYKGTLRRMNNDLSVASFSYEGNGYLPEPGQTNAFDYREMVNAVYGVVSRNVGKFDLQGGLRLEHASTTFDLKTTSESYDNRYSSFFPSALAAYNLDESKQLKVSYSKRIQRPDTRQLNPFGEFEDPLNVRRGNPYLQPEYTHAFEAGYQQSFDRGSLQVTPFYRHTVNEVQWIHRLGEDGVTVTTFENAATQDSYGTEVTGALRMGVLSGFGGFSAFQQVTDGSNLATDVSNNSFGWSLRGNLNWQVTPGFSANGFLMYRAPMNTGQGRVGSRSFLNVGLRQKLSDRASLNLRVMDPFNTMGMNVIVEDPRFYQEEARKFGARGVFLSFNYTFGKPPRVRQQRPDQPEIPQDESGIPQ